MFKRLLDKPRARSEYGREKDNKKMQIAFSSIWDSYAGMRGRGAIICHARSCIARIFLLKSSN